MGLVENQTGRATANNRDVRCRVRHKAVVRKGGSGEDADFARSKRRCIQGGAIAGDGQAERGR